MFGSAWRNFKFFESAGVSDPPLLPPHIEIVSCCLSHAYLFVGDAGGQIHVLDRASASMGTVSGRTASKGATSPSPSSSSSTLVATFQGYTGPITHMKYLRGRNLLVTLGDDDSLNTGVLRLWQVDACVALCKGSSSGGSERDGALWRPPSREHRLFTLKHPAPSAAAGAVLVKVNQNEERLRSLTLRASSNRNRPASPAGQGPSDEDGIPATALLTCVVAFDVAEDAQHAAAALTNGECVVLHGDLARDRRVATRRIRSTLASGRMFFVGFPPKTHVRIAAPIVRGATNRRRNVTTIVGVSDGNGTGVEGDGDGYQVLYTAFGSMTTVWAIDAAGAYSEYPCHEGSRLGAAGPACACMTPEGHLVVCTAGDGALSILRPRLPQRKENHISCGGTDAGAATTASSLVCFDPTGTAEDSQSLSLPSVTTLPIGDDASVGGRKCVLRWHAGYAVLLAESPARPDEFYLQCYDMANRIRALGRQQERHTDVAFVLSDGSGDLLVLSQTPGQTRRLAYSVVALREMDTLAKLDLLFTKECYDIAKRIAESQAQGVDPALHRLIEKRYADYLYGKGKYAEAMDEYVACIGSLEPSYVIRRYMQSSQMELLTRYLEHLHQRRRGFAVHVSHTTLLLNCYIRQRDRERLLAFVRRDDVRFDAPNAIAVCRQGGHYDAALLIADKYAQVYERASILIHDLHQPQEALAYVCTLGVDDAEDILKKTGKQLLAWEPLRTTDAILQLCVRWSGPARRLPVDLQTQRHMRPARRANPIDFLPVFVDAPVSLLNFLRGIVASGVLESGIDTAAGGGGGDALDANETEEPAAEDVDARQAVYNTLFELLVTEDLPQSLRVLGDDGNGDGHHTTAKEEGEGDVFPVEPTARRREQAMVFLEACAGRYDDYAALSLCHQHSFEEGTLFLLRKLGLTMDIINVYGDRLTAAASSSARRDVTAALLREVEGLDKLLTAAADNSKGSIGDAGEIEKDEGARTAMWAALLTLLVQSPHTEWQDVVRVLDRIESQELLSPTVVMETLCSPRSQLQLRTVRDYCQRAIQRQLTRMHAAQEETASRLQRVQELEREVVALQTTAVVFPCAQCAHCAQPLDFPAVHFMCRHSFHQRCLNTVTQCNLCAVEHQRRADSAKERLDSLRSSEGMQRFFDCLRQSGTGNDSDGFGVLAESISMGVLGPASATSAAMASGARRPEASLFDADPGLRLGVEGADDGQQVYDANGDVMDADSVEWW